jgi:hypothetical protein
MQCPIAACRPPQLVITLSGMLEFWDARALTFVRMTAFGAERTKPRRVPLDCLCPTSDLRADGFGRHTRALAHRTLDSSAVFCWSRTSNPSAPPLRISERFSPVARPPD